MPGRVYSEHASSTGVMVDQPVVLMGLHVSPGGTAGDVTLTDGNGGEEKLRIHLSTDSTGDDITIPGGGIEFETNLFVDTLATSSELTVFYK